jgi:hypothetical protein
MILTVGFSVTGPDIDIDLETVTLKNMPLELLFQSLYFFNQMLVEQLQKKEIEYNIIVKADGENDTNIIMNKLARQAIEVCKADWILLVQLDPNNIVVDLHEKIRFLFSDEKDFDPTCIYGFPEHNIFLVSKERFVTENINFEMTKNEWITEESKKMGPVGGEA